MKISEIKKGKYIIAVSGGVDSMVLLDILAKNNDLELVVAHFDHGIRSDSQEDAKLVEQVAKQLGATFELGNGQLGHGASEEQARDARYAFLNQVKNKHQALAIITAHHSDDAVETAIINILRGTSPKGLSALASNTTMVRPLLDISKQEIINYATKNKITWREDSTNKDPNYLRNYIRQNLSSKISADKKNDILANIDKVEKLQKDKDKNIAKLSQIVKLGAEIDRQVFTLLPKEVGMELIASWLREMGYSQFDTKTLSLINLAIRTAKPNTKHNVGGNLDLAVDKFVAKFN